MVKWTPELVETHIREAMTEFGIDCMPTANALRDSRFANVISAAIRLFGSMDECADALGIRRAEHDSRKGWAWEEWVGEEAEARGFAVESRGRVKAPFDLSVNGKRVDVKVAIGAWVANGWQWTWRIGKREHSCDFYALVAAHNDRPPVVYVVPAERVPLTCTTTRGTGKLAPWRGRWDLFRQAA